MTNEERLKRARELASKIEWTDILKPENVSIALFWSMFAKTALSGLDENSVQYREMRKVYICGFTECFKFMSDFAGNLTEDEACEVFSKIATESNGFITEFTEGFVNG